MLPRQHGVHYYKFSVKMATKRPAEEPAGASLAKKPRDMIMSHLDIGPAGGDDDLNIKVIQVGITAMYWTVPTYQGSPLTFLLISFSHPLSCCVDSK